MIIVKLAGGLGNQMFQYAAARRLALANGDDLKLDTGWFRNAAAADTPRTYELGVFNLPQVFAARAEARRLRGMDISGFPRVAKRFLAWAGYHGGRNYFREKHFRFDPEVMTLRGDVYLDGYWQSERYFSDVAETIKGDFSIATPPDEANMRLLDEIQGCHAPVAMHVRRGDYVANKNAAAVHGVAPLSYYAAAMTALAKRVAAPRFFVFSDDPDWTRKNLISDMPMTFVTHNDPIKGYEDLRLMSACSHHIIANSSFSWWGAWLCPNHDKVVIAPQQWFRDDSINTTDLIPREWLRL